MSFSRLPNRNDISESLSQTYHQNVITGLTKDNAYNLISLTSISQNLSISSKSFRGIQLLKEFFEYSTPVCFTPKIEHGKQYMMNSHHFSILKALLLRIDNNIKKPMSQTYGDDTALATFLIQYSKESLTGAWMKPYFRSMYRFNCMSCLSTKTGPRQHYYREIYCAMLFSASRFFGKEYDFDRDFYREFFFDLVAFCKSKLNITTTPYLTLIYVLRNIRLTEGILRVIIENFIGIHNFMKPDYILYRMFFVMMVRSIIDNIYICNHLENVPYSLIEKLLKDVYYLQQHEPLAGVLEILCDLFPNFTEK